jgi:hypothetical protein
MAACALGVATGIALVVRLRSRDSSNGGSLHTNANPLNPDEIEAYVREHATDLGRETFPDNPAVQWIVHGFTRTPQLILAEVEPRPDEVGYARFKFGFIAGGTKPPRHVATYCLEGGRYELLCTGPGAPCGLPRRVD